MMLKKSGFAVLLLTIMMPLCAAEKSAYIVAEGASLSFGRHIWLNNCEGCHGYGVADAPIPMRPSDWHHRVVKSKKLLFQHAIEGFISDDYNVMPARGGNVRLDDEQVKAAVDYMIFLANFYINKERR